MQSAMSYEKKSGLLNPFNKNWNAGLFGHIRERAIKELAAQH